MPPAVLSAALVCVALLGAALAEQATHWILLAAGLGGLIAWLACHQCWPRSRVLLILLLVLVSGFRAGTAAVPNPDARDPFHHMPSAGQRQELLGRWLQDAVPHEQRCRAAVAVKRVDSVAVHGRTEVVLEPCSELQRSGALVVLTGGMKRPAAANHPLLPSPAQRLQRQGIWSQFRASKVRRLSQAWTPLADVRRRIKDSFNVHLGGVHGPMLAALVLGGAQVELPEELKEMFRVAGLSHALAASGFHLSVLVGSVLVISKRWAPALKCLLVAAAMGVFLALAGSQPSVVRAVLMGATALALRERGSRARPLGVLLATLVLMLWWRPAWARDIGFQFSAAATAGLVVLAPAIDHCLQGRLPKPAKRLAALLALPCAAIVATTPLQWLHFGTLPLYGLIANVIAAPVLSVLTLAAMAMALLVLLLPDPAADVMFPLAAVLLKPAAALLLGLTGWVSRWPMAQIVAGRPSFWLVLVVVISAALLLGSNVRHWWGRVWILISGLIAMALHVQGVMADGVVPIQQWGRQWLVLRHRGRAALISNAGDRFSCRTAQQLAEGHGHALYDWIVLLDPVASDQRHCWGDRTHTLMAEQLGRPSLLAGQRLVSTGLVLESSGAADRCYRFQAGTLRGALFRSGERFRIGGAGDCPLQ